MAGDFFLEELDGGFGVLPGADDDVVELVAEEVVDDFFVLGVGFEEVGEGADGGGIRGFCLARVAWARKMLRTVSVE